MLLKGFFTENKWLRLAAKIFTGLCVAGIVASLICDLAVNKRLGWSLIVLSAAVFAWLCAMPALVLSRFREPVTLAAVSVLLTPYLMALERILNGDWFSPVALPVALTGVAVMWAVWAILRFARVNIWYKSALFVLFGNILSVLSNVRVNVYLGEPLFRISDVISVLACFAVSALLCVIGYGKPFTDKPKKVSEDAEGVTDLVKLDRE
ncbi:MAG: hypothetical protein LBR83_03590 [Clostridiales bacterium]|jgi:hypothetical protein|nr:hypothetical protein [Clostridiales bacterium]